jgi:hypothetical protein
MIGTDSRSPVREVNRSVFFSSSELSLLGSDPGSHNHRDTAIKRELYRRGFSGHHHIQAVVDTLLNGMWYSQSFTRSADRRPARMLRRKIQRLGYVPRETAGGAE